MELAVVLLLGRIYLRSKWILRSRGFSASLRAKGYVDLFDRPLTFLTSQVGLFIHLDPPVAHTINIEPMTPEDWESMDLNEALVYSVG